MNDAEAARVRAFLLGGGEAPRPGLLRRAGLAAFAYTQLPADDPSRGAVRGDYLPALTRHHLVIEELVPLMRAWRAAGVEALLFKGFHLAEFVYPVPGARFHGDVDILIRRQDEERAVRLARELGWDTRLPGTSGGRTHGVCNLRAPTMTQVDLHRFVVHSRLAVNRAPGRVTRAIWAASIEREWRGVTVRTPTSTDALLVLALQRGWWERGGLKPHDLPDMRALTAGDPDWRHRLQARAAELGASRTVSFFLSRCDPERGRFELWPERAPLMRWRIAVMPERPLLPFERLLHRWKMAPGLLLDIARVLPDLWRAWRAALRPAALPGVLKAVTPRRKPLDPSPRLRIVRTERAIRWAIRLWPGRDRTCLVRSLALYSALRRQGWPVEFVSGVRRGGSGVTGHAWLELDGAVLPELREAALVAAFRPGFRYPPAPTPAAPVGAVE